MAMAMNECPNRKACDRCHAQKLSCKRYGEEACERCLRLKTECKSSPSLRYRKQQAAAAVATAAKSENARREGNLSSASFPASNLVSTTPGTHSREQPGVHFGLVRADEDGSRTAAEAVTTFLGREPSLASIGVELGGQGTGTAGGGQGESEGAETAAVGLAGGIRGSRSPKRKRTESENILVPPDFASINIHNTGAGGGDPGTASGGIAQRGGHEGGGGGGPPESGDFSATHHEHGGPEQVTHEASILEMTDFNFEFGHAGGIFHPTPVQTAHSAQQHLSAIHPVMVDHHSFHPNHLTGGFGHTGARLEHRHLEQQEQAWIEQHLSGPSTAIVSNTPFLPSSVAEQAVTAPSGHPTSFLVTKQQAHVTSPPSLSRRSSQTGFNKAAKPARAKLKARQIVLKAPSSNAATSTPTSTSPALFRGHWMPRLSDINARLFELSAILPSQLERAEAASSSNHRHGHGGSSRSSNGKSSRRGGGGAFSSTSSSSAPFPVDEMFKLSQQFAEAIYDATSSSTLGGSSSSHTNNNSAGSSRGSGNHHHSHHRHRGRSSLNSVNDPGSSMFILSTYVRLLDMYQKVFSCIHSRLPQLDTENGLRHWKLPDVTVGSFAVESTPSLQMSLTIQLAEEFLAQLRVATAGLGSTAAAGARVAGGGGEGSGGSAGGRRRDADGSMFSGVVDVSFQAIQTREDSLGQQLADLRRDLDIILDG